MPGADDWAAAGVLLARDARPGDAAVVSPAWAERLRAVVPPHLPVFAYSRYAGEELDGVRRIWLVSLPGAPGFTWDAEVDLLERAARAEAPLTLGGLEVARLDVTYADLPLAFLPDLLDRALVTLAGAPCLPDADGVRRCPEREGGAATILRSVAEVGGRPRPCLVLHGAGSAPLALAWPSIPIGRVLRGHLSAAAEGGGAPPPVRVALRIDGEEAGASDLPSGGWRPFRFDTGRWSGQPHTVVLEARAERPATLCLEAVTLP
jgi:hypothetical protein